MRDTAEPCDGERLGAALDELLPSEPHLPYANFAPLAARPGSARQLHRRRWLEPCDGPAVLVARRDGRPVAALRLEARPFESEHFGVRMARVEPPIAMADDEVRAPALRTAYLDAVHAHLRRVEETARRYQFGYLLLDSSQPLGPPLSHFLARRSATMSKGK
jgi:hypothetical protein